MNQARDGFEKSDVDVAGQRDDLVSRSSCLSGETEWRITKEHTEPVQGGCPSRPSRCRSQSWMRSGRHLLVAPENSKIRSESSTVFKLLPHLHQKFLKASEVLFCYKSHKKVFYNVKCFILIFALVHL